MTIENYLFNAADGNVWKGLTGVSIKWTYLNQGTTEGAIYPGHYDPVTGIYTVHNLAIGWYYVEVTTQQTVLYKKTFQVVISASFTNYFKIVLTGILTGGKWRAVTTWGDVPLDLDAHCYLQGTTEVVFYNHRTSTDLKVHLDLDDRDGYGPETMTMEVPAWADASFYYRFVVYDFNQTGEMTTKADADLEVTLYSPYSAAAEHTWTIDYNSSGFYWHVFYLKYNTALAKGYYESVDEVNNDKDWIKP